MAISFTPGQVVPWEDLNTLMAQHGSPGGAKSVETLPPPKLTTAERDALEDRTGKTVEEYYAWNPIRRYHFEDGSHVDAQFDENTSTEAWTSGKAPLRVVEYKPSTTYQATQKQEAATTAAPKEGETRGPQTGPKREVWRNGAWTVEDNPVYQAPAGTDPTKPTSKVETGGDGKLYTVTYTPGGAGAPPTITVTDAAGAPVPGNAVPGKPDATKPTTQTATAPLEGHPGWRTGKRVATDAQGNKVEETYYIDPEGNPTMTPPTKPGERVEKPYVHPKTGKQYTQVTETDPVKGTSRTYFIDPETKQEVTLDAGTTIKGVPPWSPDLTKPGAGLIERARQLDELMAAGTITWEQRQQVLAADQMTAKSVADEFNLGVALLRDDYQLQTSQRNVDISNTQHRASLANQHVQNAIGLVSKFSRYLGETPGDAGKLFRGMMAGQLALATSYGGMKDIPRERMAPHLQDWANLATGGPTSRTPEYTTPSAIGAPAPPNALGLGAIGNVPAPGGAPALPADGVTNTTDAGGVPREYTPASATSAPVSMAGPGGAPQLAAALGQPQAVSRPPEADSWRQQALDRQALALGQQVAGGGLPPLPEAVGLDLNAEMGPMLSPILNTQIPGLTPDLDLAARRELEMEWLS